MNSNLIKQLLLVVLVLGLSACGSNKSEDQAPAVRAAKANVLFEADCGADVPVASVGSQFDLTACSPSGKQLSMVESFGPFKVEADCKVKSVRVKNAAGEISGEGVLNDDGTYSLPLTVGTAFSELEGCPITLQGIASGKVACDQEQRVTGVEASVAFNLDLVPAAPVSSVELAVERHPGGQDGKGKGGQNDVAMERRPGGKEDLISSERRPGGKEDLISSERRPGGKEDLISSERRPGGKEDLISSERKPGGKEDLVMDRHPDKDGKGPGPKPTPTSTVTVGALDHNDKGGQGPAVLNRDGKGPGADTLNRDGKGPQVGSLDRGGQDGKLPPKGAPGKGGQDGKGGQGPMDPPIRRLEACVNVAPCAFTTQASLSCSR